MKFQPWVDFKQDAEELPISEPPCKACLFWHPVRLYFADGKFDGVQLCHVGDQLHDFSCYRERPLIAVNTSLEEK